VNLRYGVINPLSRTGTESDTCTACAGTMILEFAALSRLSGEAVFEVGSRRGDDTVTSLWGGTVLSSGSPFLLSVAVVMVNPWLNPLRCWP